MNNRERVGEWIGKLPQEFALSDVLAEPQFENVCLTGEGLPRVIKKGYLITVSFHCDTWEEKNE